MYRAGENTRVDIVGVLVLLSLVVLVAMYVTTGPHVADALLPVLQMSESADHCMLVTERPGCCGGSKVAVSTGLGVIYQVLNWPRVMFHGWGEPESVCMCRSEVAKERPVSVNGHCKIKQVPMLEVVGLRCDVEQNSIVLTMRNRFNVSLPIEKLLVNGKISTGNNTVWFSTDRISWRGKGFRDPYGTDTFSFALGPVSSNVSESDAQLKLREDERYDLELAGDPQAFKTTTSCVGQ